MSLSNSNTSSLKKEWAQKLLLFFMLLVFACSSAFFAFKLKRAIIPDEPTHFYMSKYFSTTLGIPPNSDNTIRMGMENMNHKPFLYYWFNGRALSFLWSIWPEISDWQQLVFLRLTSIVYSVLSVIYCYKLAKEVIKSHWCSLLVVFMITNTLMFVFLSGGVSYDNLTNLCCFAGIYYIVCVFNGKSFFPNSLGWLAFIATGTLVKITVLPLAAIMGLLWLGYIVKYRHKINFQPDWNWKLIFLLILLILLIGLNLSIYGVNLVKYKGFTPACDEILPKSQCDSSVFVARREILNYPEKKLTLLDVIKEHKPDPLEYMADYWIYSMLKRIYGIMGHKAYFPDLIITFYRFLFFSIFIFAIRYYRKTSYMINRLLFILIFYALILFLKNYNGELSSGFQHVAIQGRYLFPVIGIIYILAAYFITLLQNKFIREAIVIFTLAIFLKGGILTILINSKSVFLNWFI